MPVRIATSPWTRARTCSSVCVGKRTTTLQFLHPWFLLRPNGPVLEDQHETIRLHRVHRGSVPSAERIHPVGIALLKGFRRIRSLGKGGPNEEQQSAERECRRQNPSHDPSSVKRSDWTRSIGRQEASVNQGVVADVKTDELAVAVADACAQSFQPTLWP